MKLQSLAIDRSRASREGSAIVLILAFLAIMVLLVAANTKTVNLLRANVRLIDKQEIARLNASMTNQSARVTSNLSITNLP